MALTERLALIVSLDAQGAVRGLENVGKAADRNLGKAESRIDRTAQRMQKAGAGMLAGAGLAATALYKAGQSAADLEQAVGGTEAVFKDASGTIDRFAKGAARNMGLSERAFREATTSFGGQLKGLGFGLDDAVDKSVELTGVAADLAATYGGTTAEAVQALGAALRGEADPAERFNLFLNQTRVNAKAVELGLADTTSKVDANAKAQATLALITEQSADAQGQFAREAGTAAGQMQIASAEFENAKAALGEAVAPILADVAGRLSGLASGFTAANEASGGLVSKLATFGTIGLGAAGGISFVVGKVLALHDQLGDLVGRLSTSTSRLGRFGRVAAGTATQLGLVYGAMQFIGRQADHTDLSKLENGLVRLGRGMKPVDEAAVAFEDLGAAVELVTRPSVASQVENFSSAWRRAMGDTGDDLSNARAQIDDLDAALATLASRDPEAAAAGLKAITDGMSPRDAEALIGLLDQYDSALADVDTAERVAADGADDLAAGIGGATGAIDEQVRSLENLYDALFDAFDAESAYRHSIDDTEDALAGLVALEKEGKAGTEEYARAVLDAEDDFRSAAEAAAELAGQYAAGSDEATIAEAKARAYQAELVKLRDGVKDGSPLAVALDKLIFRLGAIPSEVTSTVTVRIQEQRLSIGASKLAAGDVTPRAHGGPVSSGMPYIVGERGPELFVPAASGSIVPNGAMAAGSTVVNINVSGSDPTKVVEAVSRYIKSNGQPAWLRSA